ncbi:hypothetical protein [Advenella mimigardefordensis]|uniref:hypothetical protein n=1 Tax=Advenella mimigardefordensis TaxID=302406 RepID=UPI00046D2868|nr:hypothetical protein [Advenella mimigardefordensis]
MDSNYFVLELDLNNHSVEAGRRVLYFDGYMISEDEFFVSCDVSIEKIDSEQIKNASGEFIYVWQNTNGLGQREIGVCTDLFGFYSAFYHFEGSVVTISNSFKALKKHLDNRPNTELTLNVEYLAPLILSNYSSFCVSVCFRNSNKRNKNFAS